MDYPFRAIEKTFENFSDDWFNLKLSEFKKSLYYSEDRLKNGEVVIYTQQINEILDCDGNMLSCDLIEKEIDTSFDLSFSDFLISGDHYYHSIEILAQYHYLNEQIIGELEAILKRRQPDIKFYACELADKLAHFYNNFVNMEATNNFTILLEDKINEQVDLILDPDYSKEVESFKCLFFNEFEIRAEKKLSAVRINKLDDVLNFNLNLEDFTALFALIIKSDFIATDNVKSNNFIPFALKHFKVKPEKFSEIFVALEERTFTERYKRQIGQYHRLTALDRIIETLKSSFADIEIDKRKK